MKFIRTILALLVAVVASSVCYAGSDPDNWDAKAVEVLKQMDAYTDSMEKFIVDAEAYTDASIGEGLVISNPSITRVAVDRPGSLHSTTTSGPLVSEIFLHQGALTVYSTDRKFFTRAEVPKTLKEGLMFALNEFDVETPLLDLVIIKSLDQLVSEKVDVIYVTGDSSIRGVDCHHVLLSGPKVDLQIWIEKGDKPVPRRTLMTYKLGEGMPRHEVFQDWNAKDSFDASEFEFEPPEGAIEIDFIDAR